MSVHSNHYESEEEYLRDLRWEYRREQEGLYHHDDDEPVGPPATCETCRHCKLGLAYTHEVIDVYGRPLEQGKTYGAYGVTMKINREPKGRIYLCALDEDELKQTETWRTCDEWEE